MSSADLSSKSPIEVTSNALTPRPRPHRLNRSRVRFGVHRERDLGMSVLTDHPPYPISAAAARQLARPLFGHVVDGAVVPSRDGGTMPVRDPATGDAVATAAAGSAADVERAVRSARAAFDDGRWRYLPPLEQERRLRRLSALIAEHGDELAELDVIDSGLLRLYAGFIVQFAVDGLDYYSGWPSKLQGTVPAGPPEL